ncbi:unnamed protein product [Prorocentrum cordatum]|uniref:Uncharacterized protein n=1 Tax=Prorocentrum cordatum TaxID=2364126 RepID=A0ABN9VB08_9DINO|nr:unnamed protein product [Polarella glacialis]
MVNFDAFARCLCERWHVPLPLETMSAVRWAPVNVDAGLDIADTPPVVLPEWCLFGEAGKRIVFFVDCQSAGRLVNGEMELTDDTYTHVFNRISNMQHSLCRLGWRLRGITNPLWSGSRGGGTRERTILRTWRCATGTPCFGTGRTGTR